MAHRKFYGRGWSCGREKKQEDVGKIVQNFAEVSFKCCA